MSEPFVACLCPTYNRLPGLVENSIACFRAQTYPADRRRLIVLDDSGKRPPQRGDGWQVIATPTRYPSLAAKYNAMAALAIDDGAEVLVVWEDDDIYLPWHIDSHVRTLWDSQWSLSLAQWSLYPGYLIQEVKEGPSKTAYAWHGAMAFTREAFEQTGGWPETGEGTFDQQFVARMRGYSPRGDPAADCTFYRGWSDSDDGPKFNVHTGSGDTSKVTPVPLDLTRRYLEPGYVYRWGSTGNHHGESFMRSPDDHTWYESFAVAQNKLVGSTVHGPIVPKLDSETERVLVQLS